MDTATVLIIEDDPASAKLLAVILAGEGIRTWVTSSAEDALEKIDAELPAVIVLDLVLPLMSGLLLAKLLKARDATRHIPIIAVTAFNGEEAKRIALAAGCNDYLRKPIDAAAFTTLVSSYLGRA
jgi:CheY-like chemotaxis protein